MEKSILTEEIKEKWAPVIDADGVAEITDRTVRNNTIRVLENTVNETATGTTSVGGIAGVSDNITGTNPAAYDPVLISMVRRAMPVLVANDIMGVQPMSGPTGLIFAMNSKRQKAQNGADVANWGVTGYDAHAGETYTTAAGEVLGKNKDVFSEGGAAPGTAITVDGTGGVLPADSTGMSINQSSPWREATFDISKTSVTAKTRAMKGSYTQELAQDLKAVHGLDAETELASLISGELVSEMNREMVDLVNAKAIVGAQQSGIAATGTFNVAADTDARWQIEAYKGLYFQIEREANIIGKQTGRGRGNILIVSADVASALEASQKLDTAALGGTINGGWTGISYAGVLNGKYKVFIDPYAASDYVTVGYKGQNVYDCGLFYCPYTPMQMMKATGEDDFSPRIGFKSRFGLVANPFVGGATSDPVGTNAQNQYYRTFAVTQLAVTH